LCSTRASAFPAHIGDDAFAFAHSYGADQRQHDAQPAVEIRFARWLEAEYGICSTLAKALLREGRARILFSFEAFERQLVSAEIKYSNVRSASPVASASCDRVVLFVFARQLGQPGQKKELRTIEPTPSAPNSASDSISV